MAHVEPYILNNGARKHRVRWKGSDGRQNSKSFPRKKDADRFRIEIESRGALGDLYEAAPETFEQYFEAWLDRYKGRVRRSTYDRCKDLLPRISAFYPFPLDRILPADVEDHVMALATTAPRQAELVLRTIKMVLRDAKQRGHRINEGVLAIKPPRTEVAEMMFLSWALVEELSANTVEPFGNLIQLAALTGLRQGELFALPASAIEFDRGTLAVAQTLTKTGDFERPKTPASRRQVDLSERAEKLVREQLVARVPNELDLLFPSPQGHPINAANFRQRVFAPACKRSGIDGLRFHDLRHTYAALMVRAGAHPKYLQVQMGHSSIKVTLDRYGHLLPDENRTVLAILDQLTEGAA